MPIQKGNFVLVEWVDSNVTHGWRPEYYDDDEVAHCRTIGILKSQDKKRVILAFGDSDCGSVMETITIPRGCILSVRELQVR